MLINFINNIVLLNRQLKIKLTIFGKINILKILCYNKNKLFFIFPNFI